MVMAQLMDFYSVTMLLTVWHKMIIVVARLISNLKCRSYLLYGTFMWDLTSEVGSQIGKPSKSYQL